MQYSGTFTPTAPTALAAVASTHDPIADAREMLRRAAHLPFAASQPGVWSSRFVQHVGSARDFVRQHIFKSLRPDSPMSAIGREEPRLTTAIRRQKQEHADLAQAAEELYAQAKMSSTADIWRMIELGEQAILLEMALARHHNRLTQLVYESTHQDIGGEG